MKQISIACVVSLVLLLLAGCGGRKNEGACIGVDKAQQLALDACGMTASGAESVSAALADNDGRQCYEVDITASGQKYHYEIDAYTGTILAAASSAISEGSATGEGTAGGEAGSGAGGETAGDEAGSGAGGETAGSDSGSGSGAGAAGNSTAADGMISLEDAKANVLAHADLAENQVTFAESKLEFENGRQVYELEFYSDDNREYDYEVDAFTGEIVSFDYDAEHYAPSGSAEGEAVTADEAKALALAKVPGAASGDLREFETDYDNGRTEYEGKIIYNGKEYEFEIDGSSGRFLSWEEETLKER